jgi:hypothetical protein
MSEQKEKVSKKTHAFTVTGEFEFRGQRYSPGDPFDPPANYELMVRPTTTRFDHPEDTWPDTCSKFHIPDSGDGRIVKDPFAIGGRVEIEPTHKEHIEFLPVVVSLPGLGGAS